MKFTVIGISDSQSPTLNTEAMDAIKDGKVFSGGIRHHSIIGKMLPADSEWIDIKPPLDNVFELYKKHGEVVVFASGDPLFYGFANTIIRKLPDAELKVIPYFNSLQSLAHRLVLPYNDMVCVSLTGRDWHGFDQAVMEGHKMIGILTDGNHSPDTIASRLMEYGYDHYRLHVGEHLGNKEEENIRTLTAAEAATTSFLQPNAVIITGVRPRRQYGIPDDSFELLDSRKKMITKMPIRLLSLQAMDLNSKCVFWDIGFCTGSISIEARRMYPHLHVEAFEQRPECEEIIKANSRLHGTPGIGIHIGDFLLADCESIASKSGMPDAVFVGGHGGKLKEIMSKAVKFLSPGGCIVMNSVSESSKAMFEEVCPTLGLHMHPPMRIVLDNYNPIEILKCELQ